jgi:type II secretory pathway predicted ATPase ExeA
MESTIWFTDGFVIITGEIGAGKTTLIESLLHELDKDVVVAQINQTQVTELEFLQAVLVQFGFSPFKMKKAEAIATLNNFLIEQYAAGRKVLLIVDEAQNLPMKVLEEVRLLSGVETTKEKVLRIILAGQPELNEKLDSPELVQLVQRVRLRFHLTPLSEEDLRAYVLHRLEVAGSGGREIFADDTFPLLYRYTGGVPRLVNTLCETAMMAAFNEERDHVNVTDVHSAIEELRWPEFARRGVAAETAAAQDTTSTGRFQTDTGSTGQRSGPRLYVPPPEEDVVFARVKVCLGSHVVGELPLQLGPLVVGRTPDNDLQIDNRFVSRHHCRILTTREHSILEDLGSTNGIRMQGKRVKRRRLRNGDVISLGHYDIVYSDERTSRGTEAETGTDFDDERPIGESGTGTEPGAA